MKFGVKGPTAIWNLEGHASCILVVKLCRKKKEMKDTVDYSTTTLLCDK